MKEYKLRNLGSIMRYSDFPGKKMPIIIIHGLGCAGSFDYTDMSFNPALGEHRKIVVDLLGAGYSDKPVDFPYTVKAHAEYLREFIEDLEIERLIVYGHSLGGAVAIELAALCGEKIEKLILNEPNLEPSRSFEASYQIAHLSEDGWQTELPQLIAKYEREGSTMWAATMRNWLPEALYRLSKDAASERHPSWKDMATGFDIPHTFIYGERTLPDNDYDDLVAKGEKVVVVKDAAHPMAWEMPDATAKAVQGIIE